MTLENGLEIITDEIISSIPSIEEKIQSLKNSNNNTFILQKNTQNILLNKLITALKPFQNLKHAEVAKKLFEINNRKGKEK